MMSQIGPAKRIIRVEPEPAPPVKAPAPVKEPAKVPEKVGT